MNIQKILGVNWKTNLAALITFFGSVPAVITAITNWAHHQPADWRGAALGIVVAAGFWAAKDSSTHSTPAQVQAAGDKQANK